MNNFTQHYENGKLTDLMITRIAGKWAPYMTAGVWILWECGNTKLPASIS